MKLYHDDCGLAGGSEWWICHGSGWWTFPSLRSNNLCVFTANYDDVTHYGPPPSDTLRTLIECGAPWYAVLDKFVEEYPQWEEILAWAPTANSEGE